MAFAPHSLTMSDANSALEQGCAAIAAGESQIDLSQLVGADSSAVAAMLAWQRAAQSKGKSIAFLGASASLKSLAKLYGVEDLLFA
jgi:phospholipid transport system transporter-binding protein